VALANLPAELLAEATVIVQAQAEEFARQVRLAYGQHRVTGNLQEHVAVEFAGDGVSAAARVKSTAYHAWMFENGTTTRMFKGARRGAARPQHVFIPIAIARRRLMYAALVDLVERAGFTVTGSV
jgi:hypothetical protein